MFKDKLKELRVKKGLSQQELGDKIYVSRSAICKWESGLGVPSDANLKSLCEFFEVEEEWLFDREDLKESIEITKKENSNLRLALISLILNIFFIFYTFSSLSQNYYVETLNKEHYSGTGWDLFLGLEIISLIVIFVLGINISVLSIIEAQGKLNIKFNLNTFKKIQLCSIISSVLSFIWFTMTFFERRDRPYDYMGTKLNENVLFQYGGLIFLLFIVSLICFFKNKKGLTIISSILLIFQSLSFILLILFFVSYLQSKIEGGVGVAIGVIFSFLSAFVCCFIGGISIPFAISMRRKYKNKFSLILLVIIIALMILSIGLIVLEFLLV